MRITIVLLILILSSYLVSAQEEQFGISLNCIEDCKGKELDYSKDIMLFFTVKNNLNYWVSIGKGDDYGSATLRLKIESINLQDNKKEILISSILGKRVFIKPKSEINVYMPLEPYNELNKDNRLGDWKIIPQVELSTSDVKFYENNPFNSKIVTLSERNTPFNLPSTIKGNVLEFKVVKPEVEVEKDTKKPLVPKGFWDNKFLWWILGIVGTIISGYVLWRITRSKSRRRR